MWEAVQMLEAVLDSVDAAILMVDSDFQVVLCNKKFGEFFGLDPQSLIGEDKRAAITRDIKWRVKNPEDFQKRLFWLYENPEVTANDEVEVSLPRRRVLHRFSGPVYDKERKMLGRVEVYTDITDAKTLHEELELKTPTFICSTLLLRQSTVQLKQGSYPEYSSSASSRLQVPGSHSLH